MKSRSAALLASAVRIMKGEHRTTFTVQPWREIMKEREASDRRHDDTTRKLVNRMADVVADKVIEKLAESAPPAAASGRHQVLTTRQPKLMPAASPFAQGDHAREMAGIDKAPEPVVHSGSLSSTTAKGTTVEQVTETKQEADAKAAQAKIAAKEAKIAEANAKKAKAEADKLARQVAREADLKASREKRDAEREARAAQLQAENPNRTYTGSMLSLADKVKAGLYVKGVNGQLRSSDEVATALESCSPANVVALLQEVLSKAGVLEGNPYAHLNIGQQSMNMRNKLRGAIKAEKVNLADVIALRDEKGFADVEAKQAEAKAEKERKAAEKKAQAEAAAAKAKEAKPAPAPVISSEAADVEKTPAAPEKKARKAK